MPSFSCGILYSTTFCRAICLAFHSHISYIEHLECSVLVVWREGHTRSHSEHGSQAS